MKTLTAMFTKLFNGFEAYFVDMLGLSCLENDMDNMEENTEMDNAYPLTALNKCSHITQIAPTPLLAMG